MHIPDAWARTVASVHGERGVLWLADFDSLLRKCEQQWGLELKLPSPYDLSYNFVVPASRRDGTEAVLKLGVPNHESMAEVEALRQFAGRGAVRLLEFDASLGAMLLDIVQPGVTLAESGLHDDEATLAAAGVMRRIAIPAANIGDSSIVFPTVENWSRGLSKLRERYNGGTDPLPEGMVIRAEATFRELLASATGELLLLHGDLHHGNLLSSDSDQGPWLAIDPKGVIGEAEYGTIPLLMNELPQAGQIDTIRRRVELLCEALPLNRARILAWGYSHSVLSAWWCVEDGVDGMEASLERAKWFEQLQAE
ncbi:MAG: aminoglycoside phosphotransferase family protein [Candidatus Pristimantibacillus sp.]